MTAWVEDHDEPLTPAEEAAARRLVEGCGGDQLPVWAGILVWGGGAALCLMLFCAFINWLWETLR